MEAAAGLACWGRGEKQRRREGEQKKPLMQTLAAVVHLPFHPQARPDTV